MDDYIARTMALLHKHTGVEVVSGLSPTFFQNNFVVPFTCYARDGESVTQELGISIWELMMLERFCRLIRPRSILIVGNGFGWSTIALALMNPDAQVVAIEPHVAIEQTNRIAFLERLRCIVVQGVSPEDNDRIVRAYCPVVPDFVLIDGLHTSEQIVRDFDSLLGLCGRQAIYFFHDVVLHRMFDGMETISSTARKHGMTTDILMATSSGMAVTYADDAADDIKDVVRIFRPSTKALEVVAKLSGIEVPRHRVG
jgi:predicted O-methyltransferase YrrM